MPGEERGSQAAMIAHPAGRTRGPRWRTLLEARWQDRVREVTELSLAYHVAVAAVPGGGDVLDRAGQPCDDEPARVRPLAGRFPR